MPTHCHFLAACLSVHSLVSTPALRADILQSRQGKQQPQKLRSTCYKLLSRLCRDLFWSSLAISFFGITAAAANAFTAQQTLAESYPALQDWFYTIARIEITKGSVVGSNGSPPTVEFKIVEILRKGRFPPQQPPIVASWLEDPGGGEYMEKLPTTAPPYWHGEDDQWTEYKRKNDQWGAIETVSPPTGTKLIVFSSFEPYQTHLLMKPSVFSDTPENKATALSGVRHQPFLKWSSGQAFWLIFVFTLASFFSLFVSPIWAPSLSLMALLSHIFYNSQASELSIRLDLFMIYPTLGFAALTALIGVALKVKSIGPD